METIIVLGVAAVVAGATAVVGGAMARNRRRCSPPGTAVGSGNT